MDSAKVISALGSELRREVLKILVKRPCTVLEVLMSLKMKGFDVKHRETVYRALEKLVDAELVDKYYEKEKGICYELTSTQILIKLTEDSFDTEVSSRP